MNSMNVTTKIQILITALFLMGFTSSLDQEGSVHQLSWNTLADVEWVMDGYDMTANVSEDIKALDGKTVVVEGYMFPLEYRRRHTMFLLSKAPMSHCYFCGPGEAEYMIYIEADSGIRYDYGLMKIKGTFKLSGYVDMGILYEMTDAELVR